MGTTMSHRTTPTSGGRTTRPARRRNRASLRAVVGVALVLLSLLAGGRTAHAHASLVESTPTDGARLDAAPSVLRLVFNEDVEILETTRLSRAGETVPYQASVDGGLVEIRPESALDEGRWSLAWQIVSADGHLVGGVIAFVVGDASTGAVETATAGDAEAGADANAADGAMVTGNGALDRVLELLGWIALIVALGAHLAGRDAIGRTAAVAAAVFPLLRIVDAYDLFATAALRIGETRAALAATTAAVLLLAAWSVHTPHLRNALLAGGTIVWSAQALLSGHPNLLDPRWFHAGVAAVHLGGALTWSAAVTAILLDERVAVRASRIATASVAALVPATGVLAATFLVGNPRGEWETILLVKILLVTGALALGLRNHRAVRSDGANLRRAATLEIALIAGVAVLTATLTTHVPSRIAEATERPTPVTAGADDAADTGNAAGADAPGGEAEPVGGANALLAFENGETGNLLLETAPGGRSVIHLVLRDPSGAPFTAEQAGYELENREAGIGGISGDLPVSGGMHMGEVTLPAAGTWRITVHATYDTFTTITATAEIATTGE